MNNDSLAESSLLRKRLANSPQILAADDIETPRQESSTSQDSSRAQIDGSINQSPSESRFLHNVNTDNAAPSSPFRLQMPFLTAGQLAFSALQFLPVPVLVLNNLKTVVLANEAMGKLLGMVSDSNEDSGCDAASCALESLKGQSLSQVGIDMSQNGQPVWVAWEAYLDYLVEELGSSHTQPSNGAQQDAQQGHHEGNVTPTVKASGDNKTSSHSQQAAVEVIVSRRGPSKSIIEPRLINKASENQAYAKMIISVWEIPEHQTYFTLTFTNTESTSFMGPKKRGVVRTSALDAAERKIPSAPSDTPSVSSSHGSSSSPSYQISPSSVSMSSTPFPPMGPPFEKSLQGTPSMLQKSLIMKDALLDNTKMPILIMWKDGTLAFPNLAARKLMEKDASLDKPFTDLELLSNWTLYSDDFSRRLEPCEYPMGILLKTQTPFSGMRFGLIHHDGRKAVYNALSEAIRDDETGEFLAGVITCQDVTDMAKEIDQIKERNAERFKRICDTMPQLVSNNWSGPVRIWRSTFCSVASSLITSGMRYSTLKVHH